MHAMHAQGPPTEDAERSGEPMPKQASLGSKKRRRRRSPSLAAPPGHAPPESSTTCRAFGWKALADPGQAKPIPALRASSTLFKSSAPNSEPARHLRSSINQRSAQPGGSAFSLTRSTRRWTTAASGGASSTACCAGAWATGPRARPPRREITCNRRRTGRNTPPSIPWRPSAHEDDQLTLKSLGRAS